MNQSSSTPPKHKSALREWLDSILFAVVAATIIRWLILEAFTIPTPSMENSLLVGDFLFVSKLHYGTRTPKTPLQIPLTHQTIWGTTIPSYSAAIQLPQFRLPGFSSIQSGDVVVFNVPTELQHPSDLRTNYIKRCIGAAGDRVEIKDMQVYVNGQKMENPPRLESEYFVATTTRINEENIFRENGIWEYSSYTETYNDEDPSNDESGYILHTTAEKVELLKSYDFVKAVKAIYSPAGTDERGLFPTFDGYKWNRDNYGPITVPKKGETIQLTPENLSLYGSLIQNYEGNENVSFEDNKLTINGERVSTYTFKQDYFFMMGDNRHNSLDSRYWGFVPHDHVVGKAVFVWMSIDPNPTSFWKKIRWDRIFRTIQ